MLSSSSTLLLLPSELRKDGTSTELRGHVSKCRELLSMNTCEKISVTKNASVSVYECKSFPYEIAIPTNTTKSRRDKTAAVLMHVMTGGKVPTAPRQRMWLTPLPIQNAPRPHTERCGCAAMRHGGQCGIDVGCIVARPDD